MINKRQYHFKSGRFKSYKYIETSGFESGITIYIKKRFIGFLWWTLVKDINGAPVCFNKISHAKEFMSGNVGYGDIIDYEFEYIEGKAVERLYSMTDERAKNKIVNTILKETGEEIDPDCAVAAWELEGKRYLHRAINFAKLWNYIYKINGKKLWTPLVNH